MEDIVRRVSEAYQLECAYTDQKTRGLVRKPAVFSIRNYTNRMFQGQLRPGSSDWQKIILYNRLADLHEPYIYSTIEFAKGIPGFRALPIPNQMVCIQLGFFEVWLVQAARLIDPLDGTIMFNDGSFFTRPQMEIMFGQEFVTLLFNFVDWFNSLQLNDSEIALYSAVVLHADRHGVSDKKPTLQIQQHLLDALKYQLNIDHPNAPHIFEDLASKLPEIHMLGEKYLATLTWFKVNWTHLKLPPLFSEIYKFPKVVEHQSKM